MTYVHDVPIIDSQISAPDPHKSTNFCPKMGHFPKITQNSVVTTGTYKYHFVPQSEFSLF